MIMNRTADRRAPKNEAGFTLIEAMAAMLFMAIVVPIAIEGLVVANKTGIVAERKRVAVRLADFKLNEIVIEDLWLDAETDGDFGEEWPNYTWTMENGAWDSDTMEMVTVEVFYKVQGKEYSVRLSTLVDEYADDSSL